MEHSIIPFDFAIKFLLKEPEDYEILEAFISAILKKFKYPSVKIVKLMDPESLKERMMMKTCIVDALVKTEDNQYFIIEIDKGYTGTYLEKANYVSSRFKAYGLRKKEKYNIHKVIHINLLYSNNPECKNMIYHITSKINSCAQHSDVIEYDTREPVMQAAVDRIFTEYFIMFLKKADDAIIDEFDEWIYMLIHGKLNDDFKMSVRQKVQDRLNELFMPPHLKQEMEIYFDEERKQIERDEAKLKEGIEKGINENMKNIIQKMRDKNQTDEMICTLLDITPDELNKIFNN